MLNSKEKFRVQKEMINLRKKNNDKERLTILTNIAPDIDWKRELVNTAPAKRTNRKMHHK